MVNMEIPKGYYEEELKRALDDFEKSILNNGMSKTEFLISIAKTEEEIKNERKKHESQMLTAYGRSTKSPDKFVQYV